MEEVLRAAFIGLLQGLTEFIPISSSAHLELAPWLLGWEDDPLVGSLAFDVFLHLGTFVALVAYFWRDIVRLAIAFFASIFQRRIAGDPDRRLAWLLALATVPGAALGYLLEGPITELFHEGGSASRLAIAGFLVVGAVALLAAERRGAGRRPLETLRAADALAVGLAQGAALLPGISRSGSTIAAGLALGLQRDAAARFSFLLATPITFGAGLYGSRHLFAEPLSANEWLALAAGLAASAVAGVVAIGFLLRWLRRRSVAAFSVYRVLAAAVVVALVLAGR